MFKLSYSKECEFQGTIRIPEKDKFKLSLGPYTDYDGKKWNLRGIFFLKSGYWVQACPQENLHPYYTDTSMNSYGLVSQTWEPYKIEIISD